MPKNYDDFRDAIGLKESTNNYQCTNQFGYLGCFQFGMARLTDFGIAERIPGTSGYANSKFQWVPPFSKEGFLSSVQLQNAVFDNHVANLIATIKKDCGSKIGTEVHGVLVTMSGAVACCHLLGIGGLVDFLNRGIIDKDGDGTTAIDYIQKFNGYDLGLINPWTIAQLAYLLAAHPTASTQPLQTGGAWSRGRSLWSSFLGWFRSLF